MSAIEVLVSMLTSLDWITNWQNATLLASVCEHADTSRVYFQRVGETKLLIC